MFGDPGGVADGLWVGVPRVGSFGLAIGELLGLPERLAFLLKKKKNITSVLGRYLSLQSPDMRKQW